jgi:hypothetical protein
MPLLDGLLKVERLESKIILKVLGASKPNGPKQDRHKRRRSPLLEGGEP